MNEVESVYIVDDDLDVASAISTLVALRKLRPVVSNSAEQFFGCVDRDAVGCVVADVQMPGMDGLELLSELSATGVTLPVILVTGHGNIAMCVEAMKRGAFHFLEKPYRPDELLSVIHSAVSVDRKQKQTAVDHKQVYNRLHMLNPVERQIVDLLLEGKVNKEIAAQFDVSVRTVQFRITAVLRKIGVRSRPELLHKLMFAAREALDA
jgi:two-component system, LuxR family, response regulator DctR